MRQKRRNAADRADSNEKSLSVTIATVRDKAVFLLARREHGRLELRDKLLKRDYPADLVGTVLDQLRERGLQCDVRFAESYTRMRINRGFGVNKVRADLQSRRLSREIVEDAIAESGADWDENAFQALVKRFSCPTAGSCNTGSFIGSGVDDIVTEESVMESEDSGREIARRWGGVSDIVAERAKMQRFLQSRGYTSAQVFTAIKRMGQLTG